MDDDEEDEKPTHNPSSNCSSCTQATKNSVTATSNSCTTHCSTSTASHRSTSPSLRGSTTICETCGGWASRCGCRTLHRSNTAPGRRQQTKQKDKNKLTYAIKSSISVPGTDANGGVFRLS